MSVEKLKRVLANVYIEPMRFENWRFRTRKTNRGPQVCLLVDVICIRTGKLTALECKWLHVDPGEKTFQSVDRVKDMVLKTIMHEVLEHFFYRGKKPFDPHFDFCAEDK